MIPALYRRVPLRSEPQKTSDGIYLDVVFGVLALTTIVVMVVLRVV